MRILITGGAGFIGAHLVEHVLNHTDADVITLDRLDTSGNLNRLSYLLERRTDRTRVKVVHHDLRAPINEQLERQIGRVNVILHLAAGSHVDRSILDPLVFVYDNVVGTCNILEFARRQPQLERVLYFSTDEVFGPTPHGGHKEWDRYKSSNPYAATKAGGEELAVAFHNTYRLPVIITHTMNVIGPMQASEKFVPSTIHKVMAGEQVIIHADPSETIPGSRFYIHAYDVADAVLFLLSQAENGEKYNIVGEREMDNLHMAQALAEQIGKPLHYKFLSWHASRPGHDLRYGLDGSKLAAMGWKHPTGIDAAIKQTVHWYENHREWL